MKCDEVLQNLSLLFDQELDCQKGELIRNHLEKCLPCQVLWNTFKKTIDLFRSYNQNTRIEVSAEQHHQMLDILRKRLAAEALRL